MLVLLHKNSLSALSGDEGGENEKKGGSKAGRNGFENHFQKWAE